MLREVNLAALAKLQTQKTVICEAALEAAAKAGIRLPADRFAHLLARQKENFALTQSSSLILIASNRIWRRSPAITQISHQGLARYAGEPFQEIRSLAIGQVDVEQHDVEDVALEQSFRLRQ